MLLRFFFCSFFEKEPFCPFFFNSIILLLSSYLTKIKRFSRLEKNKKNSPKNFNMLHNMRWSTFNILDVPDRHSNLSYNFCNLKVFKFFENLFENKDDLQLIFLLIEFSFVIVMVVWFLAQVNFCYCRSRFKKCLKKFYLWITVYTRV